MNQATRHRAKLSVFALFLIHGLTFAAWVSRIPAAQQEARLSEAQLGVVLLGAAVGSLICMPIAGQFVGRYGSRAVAIALAVFFPVSLIPLGFSHEAWSIALSLALLGGVGGATNVAMNAQAALVEHAYGRPIMSTFHGLFSIGGMIGSAAGGWLAGQGISRAHHLLGMGLLLGLGTALALRGLLLDAGEHQSGAGLTLRIPRPLLLVGALCFCNLLGEGAMADWSALYLRQYAGTGVATAAFGYAVFSACMAIGRLSGDRLTIAWGRVTLVRRAAALATAGMLLALAVPVTPVALFGFAAVGAGLSVITPLAFSAGAHSKELGAGAGVAAVTTAGYLGLLAGPPLIGFIAELTGLRIALGTVALLSALSFTIAPAVRESR